MTRRRTSHSRPARIQAITEPRPLACPHCGDTQHLLPVAFAAQSAFGAVEYHVDLVHEDAHEYPRESGEGKIWCMVTLVCRSCEGEATLDLTAGANGAFLRYVADEPEGEAEQATE